MWTEWNSSESGPYSMKIQKKAIWFVFQSTVVKKLYVISASFHMNIIWVHYYTYWLIRLFIAYASINLNWCTKSNIASTNVTLIPDPQSFHQTISVHSSTLVQPFKTFFSSLKIHQTDTKTLLDTSILWNNDHLYIWNLRTKNTQTTDMISERLL